MKVYVVVSYNDDSFYIHGVFTTKEQAEYVQNSMPTEAVDIDEFEIDQSEYLPNDKTQS